MACKFATRQVKKWITENWKFLFANIVGFVGIYIALCIFVHSGRAMGYTFPMACYQAAFVGSIVYGMGIAFHVLAINIHEAVIDFKKERKIKN